MLNEEMVAATRANSEYIRATAQTEFAELERRRKAYRGITPAPDLTGRTVIVVDDGIAKGNTMKAASPVYAVGAHYSNFSQTSDEEVIR